MSPPIGRHRDGASVCLPGPGLSQCRQTPPGLLPSLDIDLDRGLRGGGSGSRPFGARQISPVRSLAW
jgi:hypothetical protein